MILVKFYFQSLIHDIKNLVHIYLQYEIEIHLVMEFPLNQMSTAGAAQSYKNWVGKTSNLQYLGIYKLQDP